MRYAYLSNDANFMEIAVRSIEVSPFARIPAPLLLETGLVIKISKYNLEGVLCAVLEDYGLEKTMEVINSLRTDTEPIYVPEKQSV